MAKTQPKIGSFDDLMKITSQPMRPIAKRLRKLIADVHPQYVEVVRLGDRAATYGVGPKKMSEVYVYILPHEKWVNLGFYKGADLADPKRLLEGTGAKMRHVKIHSIEEADRAPVRTLVKAAVAERKKALGS